MILSSSLGAVSNRSSSPDSDLALPNYNAWMLSSQLAPFDDDKAPWNVSPASRSHAGATPRHHPASKSALGKEEGSQS